MNMPFPHYTQHDAMDCGPTCLRIVAKHYGKTFSLEGLRERAHITREGVSMLGIAEAAENIGFRTIGVKISIEKLKQISFPCIVHWNQNHFVVLYKIQKFEGLKIRKFLGFSEKNSYTLNSTHLKLYVSDPAGGLLKYTEEEFCKCWYSSKQEAV